MPQHPDLEPPLHLNLTGQLLPLDQPAVMGIINCTPDSFYKQSRTQGVVQALSLARKMYDQGADILDIGGCSTRPGSEPPSVQEEMDRVMPVIQRIHKELPDMPLSIDTYRAAVAREALRAGCALVNDISAGLLDPELPAVVARFNVPYVLMHMQGTPKDMQKNPQYEHVTADVMEFFGQRIGALKAQGIDQFVLDPGFGFGKSLAHNYQLLRELSALVALGYPVLCGISRKSMVRLALEQDKESGRSALRPEPSRPKAKAGAKSGNPSGKTCSDHLLLGTLVAQTLAAGNGCHILRVHEVAEAVLLRKIIWHYLHSGVTNL